MHPLRILVLSTTVALAAGCGSGDGRPTADQWRQRWESARELVPAGETLVDDGQDTCGSALGELRAAREDLVDTPRPVLDDSVTAWLSETEALLLECPHEEDEVRERLEDIEVLAAAVDAGLRATETG